METGLWSICPRGTLPLPPTCHGQRQPPGFQDEGLEGAWECLGDSTCNHHALRWVAMCSFVRHGFHPLTPQLRDGPGLWAAEWSPASYPLLRSWIPERLWVSLIHFVYDSHELTQRQILCDKWVLERKPEVKSKRRGLKGVASWEKPHECKGQKWQSCVNDRVMQMLLFCNKTVVSSFWVHPIKAKSHSCLISTIHLKKYI